jgi:hypothetical protein
MKNLISTLLLFASFSLLAQKNGHYLTTKIGIPHIIKSDAGSFSLDYQFLRDKNGFGFGIQLEYLNDFEKLTDNPNIVVLNCQYLRKHPPAGTVNVGYSSKYQYITINFPVYYARILYETKKIQFIGKLGGAANSNVFNQTIYKYPSMNYDSCVLIDPAPITTIRDGEKYISPNLDAFVDLDVMYKILKKMALIASIQYHQTILKKYYTPSSNRLSLYLGTRFKL